MVVKAAASVKTTTATVPAVNLSEYIFTPADIWRLVKALGWRRCLAASGVLAGAIGAVMLGQDAGWVVPLAITLMAVVTRVDARAPFAVAIALLLIIAVWSAVDPATGSAAGEQSGPEALAVWAYYGLVLGVVLLLRDQVWPRRHVIVQKAVSAVAAVTPTRKPSTQVIDLAALEQQRRQQRQQRVRANALDLRPKA